MHGRGPAETWFAPTPGRSPALEPNGDPHEPFGPTAGWFDDPCCVVDAGSPMLSSMPPMPHQLGALVMRGVGASDIGKARAHNEDVVLIREDLQLFIVADGAGGHDAGDVAAHLATRSVANYFGATEAQSVELPDFDRFGLPTAARRLSRAVHKANADVWEIAQRYDKARGMGTTIVAALLSPRTGLCHVAHAGDSRCYRFRAGHLELLTQDHSLLTDVLEERPDVDDEVLARVPKHVVTRALGMKPTVRVSLHSHEALPGDRYLLCSDGLSGYVPTDVIAGILGDARPLGAIVQLLLNAANDAGGRDNIAALVVDAVPRDDAAASVRPSARLEAERQAARARADQATEPELLLLGIEEVDLTARLQAVPGGAVSDEQRRAIGELWTKRRAP
jgi:PPM family protein phosphatase